MNLSPMGGGVWGGAPVTNKRLLPSRLSVSLNDPSNIMARSRSCRILGSAQRLTGPAMALKSYLPSHHVPLPRQASWAQPAKVAAHGVTARAEVDRAHYSEHPENGESSF